ncbi:MAG: sigma-70 family RNA polymerase sigma factor [Betaproteobacteria bacterium]|nr:sigma-70 family RNA polymerase sigma factor [Betaproteobacteria bacterium]
MSADTSARDTELADLLAQCGLGNRAAFKVLYESTKSKLFAVSLRIVRERHIAEEVLQDAFVNIWNNAAGYATQKSAPLTWMTAIVRNRSLDIVRRPKLEVADEDDWFTLHLEDEAPGPEGLLAESRDRARVERCMEALDAEQKQSIALAFYKGLSHSEVAEHLKRPLGTVKTHIRRGLLKLKGCLDA